MPVASLRLLWAALLLGLLPARAPARAADPPAFADPAFQRVWERTDRGVADGTAGRSWYWGPAPGATLLEPDVDAPGGQRRVQYFDKSRMEINDPGADPQGLFYVTNGLLAVELMTGRLQVGNAQFETRCPAAIPLASDTDDATAPTYGTFGGLMAAPRQNRVGRQALAVVDRAGAVHDDPARATIPGLDLVYDEPATGRNIPRVFWDFLHATGPIYSGGQVTQGPLNDPWFYASGLPVTEAYWARVKVAGQPRDVLIQAFQRRVLTYIPDYRGSPFAVQMGNVGQHYYDWRYNGAGCAPAAAGLPRFAIDPTGETPPENIAAMQQAGAGLVRLWVGWSSLDPRADGATYPWERYDSTVAALTGAGLQVLMEVDSCPSWACTDSSGPVDKVAPERFGQFMAAAVAHYSRAPYNVHFWELFNEPDAGNGPDHQTSFGQHPEQYAALLRAATPAMRVADPQVQVFIGGMGYEWFTDEQPPGPFNRNWLAGVVAAGAGDDFDVLNFHYYPNNPHWPSIVDKATALAQVQARLGLHKPIVCTETGLTSSTDPRFQAPGWPVGSEEVQSRYLARVYAEGLAAGLQSITWFRLRDIASVPRPWEVFRLTGLIHVDASPKPALAAYRTAAREIAARPVLGRLDAAALGTPGAAGVAFGPPSSPLWVVWSTGDASVRVQPAAGHLARVVDLLGAPLATGAPLAVGPNPVYLELTGVQP